MKLAKIVMIIFILSTVIVSACNSKPKEPGPYDEFVSCLAEKDVKFMGAYWCHFCEQQKALFEESVYALKDKGVYVECDSRGKNAKPLECRNAGVTSYPTWFINGKRLSGVQPLTVIAEESGCAL